MKNRIVVMLALLVVLALAAPASAVTWRNLGSASATGNSQTPVSATAGLHVMDRDAKVVQVGVWHNSGRARKLDIGWGVIAYRGESGSTWDAGDPAKSVPPRTWKWYTVWSKARAWDLVGVNVDVYRADLASHNQTLKVKVRTR